LRKGAITRNSTKLEDLMENSHQKSSNTKRRIKNEVRLLPREDIIRYFIACPRLEIQDLGRAHFNGYDLIMIQNKQSFTYDHRTLKTRLPVRSALFKQRTGGLVVRWVTTSEYPLLYVFATFWKLRDYAGAASFSLI
jgi:hypothetical protein